MHIPYPKIRQFNDCIKSVKRKAEFVGLDENKDPIYDQDLEKPVIVFDGSVKLHGTNAGINYNVKTGEIKCQSRGQIKTSIDAHMGFVRHVEENIDSYAALFEEINAEYTADYIVIFGEWAGKGIQRSVGISQIPKSFFVFDIALKTKDEEVLSWVPNIRGYDRDFFHNILEFQTYKIEINFEDLPKAKETLEAFVEEVEKQCPVSKQLGQDGIGEGIVFTGTFKGDRLKFKVKGDKHKVVSTKDKVAITDVDLRSIEDLVAYSVTKPRIEQGVQEVCSGELDKRHTGKLLKWVLDDIEVEERDRIIDNKITGYNKYIMDAARKVFFQMIEEDI